MCDNPTCVLEDCVVEYGYCHCNCGGLTNIPEKSITKRGQVKGVPTRYISGHNSKKDGPTSLVDYIIDKVTGCWIWQRAKNQGGYGLKTAKDGVQTTSHRWYYEQKYGPVPDGLVLDHFVCQNRACCNPDHVQPVTQAENIHRGKGTKLTEEDVKKIRELQGTMSGAAIGRLFGIKRHTVSQILSEKRWRLI